MDPVVRKIVHIDMDAFYTSVEQRDRPELRGRPVVVGGPARGRGVVAAASYEARRFGIRSAMPSSRAYRLCPEAVFVRPDFKKYYAVSEQVRAIFHEVTDLVEPLSLDEAYLDVTQNRLGESLAQNVAAHLKKRIRDVTGLTASAGVGPNKFIAKIASDWKKPDGLTVVHPQNVLQFLEKLPVERIWGVGPKTAEHLHRLGVRTCGQLRACSVSELEREFGKFGPFLRDLANGVDDREVDPGGEPKSRGTETTFDKDEWEVAPLVAILREQSQEVAEDLKSMGYMGRTVTLKVKYDDFQIVTRSRTVLNPLDEAVPIAEIASELLREGTEAGSRGIRLVGVSMGGLVSPDEPLQLWLQLPLP